MNKIFVDLEMNPIDKEYKKSEIKYYQETIEIGAVMLDEGNRVIKTFQSYIKPSFGSKIREKIVNLTGITDEKVAEAEGFEKVFSDFVEWCETDYIIYSWSESDISQLKKEHAYRGWEIKEEVRYMFAHWHDVQKDFGDIFQYSRSFSLESAVSISGFDFEGAAHDALYDAMNTAELYRQMSDEKSNISQIRESRKEARKPLKTSLDDLIPWDDLELPEE